MLNIPIYGALQMWETLVNNPFFIEIKHPYQKTEFPGEEMDFFFKDLLMAPIQRTGTKI